MTDKVEYYNKIYQERGFEGVIRAVERDLHMGGVTWKPNGIVKITTRGWSDDEYIIDSLTHILSQFGHNHYLGFIVGGAYYFSEEKYCNDVEIQKELTDDESCNPMICMWCKFSTNGRRDPARSITICDGCRYNEEFEHIQIKVIT